MTERPPRDLPEPLAADLAVRSDGAQLAEVWQLLDHAAPSEVGAAERARSWEAIRAQLSVDPSVLPLARRRRPVRWAVAIAAGVAAAAIGVARVTGNTALSAPPGQSRQTTLVDGTMVTLDGGSTLRFRPRFRAWWGGAAPARTVRLEGAGFFEVARDGRPFVVETFNARVEVLGTTFSVATREGPFGGTRVEVVEGRVAVRGESPNGIVLGRGQATAVAARASDPAPATAVSPDRIALWRRGGFLAVDERIDLILGDLERHFGVTIRLINREVGSQRRTLYYPGSVEVATILHDLATARGLTVRPVQGGFEIK